MISIHCTITTTPEGAVNVTWKGEGNQPTDAEQVLADAICAGIEQNARHACQEILQPVTDIKTVRLS